MQQASSSSASASVATGSSLEFTKFCAENLREGKRKNVYEDYKKYSDNRNFWRLSTDTVQQGSNNALADGFENIGLVYKVSTESEIESKGTGLEVSLHRNISQQPWEVADQKQISMRNYLANQIHNICPGLVSVSPRDNKTFWIKELSEGSGEAAKYGVYINRNGELSAILPISVIRILGLFGRSDEVIISSLDPESNTVGKINVPPDFLDHLRNDSGKSRRLLSFSPVEATTVVVPTNLSPEVPPQLNKHEKDLYHQLLELEKLEEAKKSQTRGSNSDNEKRKREAKDNIEFIIKDAKQKSIPITQQLFDVANLRYSYALAFKDIIYYHDVLYDMLYNH